MKRQTFTFVRRSIAFVAVTFVAAGTAAATEASAHRGDVDTAPENTLPALEAAVQKGAAQIEFDVALTADGKLVLMHDATVNRTTDGEGKVSDLSFAEIRALDAGAWFGPDYAGTRVPTLEEALAVIPPDVWCNVHLKGGPALAEAAARELKRLNRLDKCFLACEISMIEAARTAVPDIKTCNMSRQTGDRSAYIAKTIALRCEFIQLHQRDGHDNLAAEVETLHDAGVTVNWYGANDAELMRTLIDAGVDYILTDKLSLCLEVLNESEPNPAS